MAFWQQVSTLGSIDQEARAQWAPGRCLLEVAPPQGSSWGFTHKLLTFVKQAQMRGGWLRSSDGVGREWLTAR